MLKRFFKDRNGATAVEYGLIVAVLSLAMAGGFSLAGNAMVNMFSVQTNIINDQAGKLH